MKYAPNAEVAYDGLSFSILASDRWVEGVWDSLLSMAERMSFSILASDRWVEGVWDSLLSMAERMSFSILASDRWVEAQVFPLPPLDLVTFSILASDRWVEADDLIALPRHERELSVSSPRIVGLKRKRRRRAACYVNFQYPRLGSLG